MSRGREAVAGLNLAAVLTAGADGNVRRLVCIGDICMAVIV